MADSTDSRGYASQYLRFSDKPEDLDRFIIRFKANLASLPTPLHKVFESSHADANDASKKELVYYHLVKCLSNPTLDLVNAKALGDGPAAIKLLETRLLGKVCDLEVSLLRNLVRSKPEDGEDLLQFYTRVDQIRLKLESINPAYKEMSDKLYTVISLDSLDDPRLDSFKNAVYVREKWPSWKEFETLMKVQMHSSQKENTEAGEIVLGHNQGKFKPSKGQVKEKIV